MSRSLPTGFAAETESGLFRPAFLVEIDWPSGMVRFWSGYGTLDWAGNTYVGTGHLGTISMVSESKDGKANGLALTLNGVPSSLIGDIMANDAQGQATRVWLAPLTAAKTLATDPYLMKDAKIDVTPVEDEGKTCNITVQIENEFIDRRVQHRRNTHEDQQLVSPGDGIFKYVAGLATKEGVWGHKVIPAGGNAGGVMSGGTSARSAYEDQYNGIDPGAA